MLPLFFIFQFKVKDKFRSNEIVHRGNGEDAIKSMNTSKPGSTILNSTINYRTKRQSTRESIEPDNGAVMYIPISTSSSCPAGSNSVADASVTGISQVIYLKNLTPFSNIIRSLMIDILNLMYPFAVVCNFNFF